jgi:hypothetical protein
MAPTDVSTALPDRRELRGRALAVLALGVVAVWQALEPLAFLLVYAWQWLLALFVTLPLALGAGRWLRLAPRPGRAALAVAAGLGLAWFMAIAMPLAITWGVREPGLAASWTALLAARFQPLALPALLLLVVAAVAGWQARAEAAAGWPRLRQVLGERAACHLAFLVLGPLLFAPLQGLLAATGLHAPRSVALALAFALCEAWPFLRAWRAPAAAAPPRTGRLARKLEQLRAARAASERRR